MGEIRERGQEVNVVCSDGCSGDHGHLWGQGLEQHDSDDHAPSGTSPLQLQRPRGRATRHGVHGQHLHINQLHKRKAAREKQEEVLHSISYGLRRPLSVLLKVQPNYDMGAGRGRRGRAWADNA